MRNILKTIMKKKKHRGPGPYPQKKYISSSGPLLYLNSLNYTGITTIRRVDSNSSTSTPLLHKNKAAINRHLCFLCFRFPLA